jgi:CheY-like chemotaxis protein
MDTHRSHRPAVLIVEDDPLIRWSGADTLAEAGFDVIEAGGAEEALAILEGRNDVLVLFTDVDMPGRFDGLELARIAHDRWPWMHIIVASGRRQPGDRQMPDNGRFVAKPYAPEQIARDIDALLAA